MNDKKKFAEILEVKQPDNNIINEIINIGDMNFNKGYLSHKYLSSYFLDSKSFILICKYNTKPIGFCLASIWNKEKLSEYTSNHPELTQIKDNTSFGVIKTMAILPAFHKKGIGSRLFKEAEQRLQKIDADILVVPAWVYNGIIPMERILSQFQYEEWFYMKQFWLDICESTTYTCIKHTGDECVCDVCFYKKSLMEKHNKC